MSCDQASAETILALLSYQRRETRHGMTTVKTPAKHSPIQRGSSLSSFGLFDELSLELLHIVLNMLDFQSLLRLSRASLRGQVLVQSLPAYRDLMEYAPTTLPALGQTKLMGVHSAALLHANLLSCNCVSCGNFGPFLFLPTCERCCYECLCRNQSLWVIPTALAAKCFALRPRQLKQIPIMRSIPGTYFVGHRISRQQRFRLVSVRAAKELAIKIHGSMEKAQKVADAGHTGKRSGPDFNMFRWLRNAPSQHQPSLVQTMLPIKANTPTDKFCGMASTLFPSLMPNKQLEAGVWCRGCDKTWDLYRIGRQDCEVGLDLVPSGVNPLTWLMALQSRARSKAELLEHVKDCPGVRELGVDI